jgi:hypothetical protein
MSSILQRTGMPVLIGWAIVAAILAYLVDRSHHAIFVAIWLIGLAIGAIRAHKSGVAATGAIDFSTPMRSVACRREARRAGAHAATSSE